MAKLPSGGPGFTLPTAIAQPPANVPAAQPIPAAKPTKMASNLRNLTKASAKHLLRMGHITPAHHAKIMASAGVPSPPKMPTLPRSPFGAIGKRPAAPLPTPGAPAAVPGVTAGMGNVLPPNFMADEG